MTTTILYLKTGATLGYFLLAAQGAFYVILRFHKAVRRMAPERFVELRRLTDQAIEMPLKVLYVGTAVLMALWLLFAYPLWGSAGYTCFALAFVLILADLITAMRISVPLNQLILLKGQVNYQGDWIRWMCVRGWCSVTGMVLLLIGQQLS